MHGDKMEIYTSCLDPALQKVKEKLDLFPLLNPTLQCSLRAGGQHSTPPHGAVAPSNTQKITKKKRFVLNGRKFVLNGISAFQFK